MTDDSSPYDLSRALVCSNSYITTATTTCNVLPIVGPKYGIVLPCDTEIKVGPGRIQSLDCILENTVNVRYIRVNHQLVVPTEVWDAIGLYVEGKQSYAELSLSSFLDKLFSR